MTSLQGEVLLSVENHVATLTLNRPTKGNALTPGMLDGVFASFRPI